jgi:fructokinase
MKVGIDLGGTKIEAVVLDDDNHILLRERMPTPQGDYAATLATIISLVRRVESEFGAFPRLGIGIPGAVSKQTGRIKNANSTCLIGRDLAADLSATLSQTIVLANDANCLALSEASDGAAAGEDVVFAVILGTGCGGGLVVNGQVLNGVNAIAGEWGHNPLPWPSEKDEMHPCYCGQKGCLETFLSGPGMAMHFEKRYGRPLSAQAISEGAEAGEEVCRRHMESYAHWLAKGLASVMNVVDPDVIVLGGGLSNVDFLYRRVPELWAQWVFSDRVDTRLVPAKWGDSSGVRGAAWL